MSRLSAFVAMGAIAGGLPTGLPAEEPTAIEAEVVIERARALIPGKVLDLTLDREHEPPVFRVKILTDAGVVKSVLIDAVTGEGSDL